MSNIQITDEMRDRQKPSLWGGLEGLNVKI
jgi:hypothetical protein